MMGRIEFKKEVHYTMNRYPENCGECPAFSTSAYQCHNERGWEGHCDLGYMKGFDMRDFTGGQLFRCCMIKADKRVVIADVD